jgi:hypothetical protein
VLNLTLTIAFVRTGWAQELAVPSDVPRSPDAVARLLTRAPASGLFKVGPFEIYPRISGSVYYDDNINNTAVNRLSDVAWTLAPGFAAEARNASATRPKSFTLEYTPVFRFYLDRDEFNSVDHGARIAGSWAGRELTIGFDQGFLVASEPIADVGDRVDQFNSNTRLKSEWRLGYKTSLNVDAALAIADYGQLTSSRDWSNTDWLNHHLSSKLSLGVGIVAGYLDVENAPGQSLDGSADQTYEQLRARVVYAVTEKVRVSASAGGELRQYRGGVEDTLVPIWDVAGIYRPRRETTFKIAIFQRYQNSARTSGQNYLSTGVSASLAQRVLDRFLLTIDANYSRAEYRATVAGVTNVRDRLDDLFGARLSLDAYLTAHWTAGVFYSYSRNDSNDPLFDYRKNQVGLQSSWSF